MLAVPSVQDTKDTATKFVVENPDIAIPGQSTDFTEKWSIYGRIRWWKVEELVEELEKQLDQKIDEEDKECSSFQKLPSEASINEKGRMLNKWH